MYPIICTIGPFNIYSYGLMLVIAFFVASSLASRQAKKEKIDPDLIFNFLFLAFIFGVVGARLFYVIANFSHYASNPFEIIMLQKGGMAWFGGLILGSLAGIVYLKRNQLPIYKVLDLIAPYLALAQAIGRIGCLLNGCCFGRASGFGIYFDVHHAVLIPTQIYSSLMLVSIFVFLRFLQDRPHRIGAIFFTYLLLYAAKRFLIEFWRADNQIVFFGLTLFQLLSILIFVFAIYKLAISKK